MARISEGFSDLVSAILDKRCISLRGAMLKTGVTHSVIGEMRKGIIPSRDTIGRFAKGMGVSEQELMVAAGYEQATDAVEAVYLALRGATNIPDEGKKQILDFAKKIEQRYTPEHKHSFNDCEALEDNSGANRKAS